MSCVGDKIFNLDYKKNFNFNIKMSDNISKKRKLSSTDSSFEEKLVNLAQPNTNWTRPILRQIDNKNAIIFHQIDIDYYDGT